MRIQMGGRCRLLCSMLGRRSGDLPPGRCAFRKPKAMAAKKVIKFVRIGPSSPPRLSSCPSCSRHCAFSSQYSGGPASLVSGGTGRKCGQGSPRLSLHIGARGRPWVPVRLSAGRDDTGAPPLGDIADAWGDTQGSPAMPPDPSTRPRAAGFRGSCCVPGENLDRSRRRRVAGGFGEPPCRPA